MQKIRMIVTKEDLCDVPEPEQTSTYKPISHCQLIDLTIEGADKEGFKIESEVYRGSEDGKIATAYYNFQYGDDPEIGVRVAWQNSYNKKVSLKFAIGLNVFVCENGSFMGDFGAFRKKHVGEVQSFTPEKIGEFLKNVGDTYEKMGEHKTVLKNIAVDQKKASRLLGELYVQDLLKETQIAIVKKEILKPTFDYKADNTAWQFYNHVTHALKTVHPTDYISTHQRVHDYFVNKFKL